MSPTADSQAHIETLVEQAADRLRQQFDAMHRDGADDHSGDVNSGDVKPAHRRPPDPRERLPWWRLAFK